jgi:hypothetical protein
MMGEDDWTGRLTAGNHAGPDVVTVDDVITLRTQGSPEAGQGFKIVPCMQLAVGREHVNACSGAP